MERRRAAHDDGAARQRLRGRADGVRRALTISVFLVAVELTCRLDDWFHFGTPLDSPIASESDLIVRDATGPHGRPFARYTKYILNNLGMRGPYVRTMKPPGVIRIVTLGASETFGLYESFGHEYPRQLEDSLRSCGRFEVVNAALVGMSLPVEDQYLRRRVASLHPDIVVLYPSPAQYLYDSASIAAAPDRTPGAGHDVSWLQLRVALRLQRRFTLLIPARVRNYFRHRALDDSTRAWRFEGVPGPRLAQFAADLRHIVASVRSIGARPILMTHADVFMAEGSANALLIEQWRQSYPHAAGTSLLQFDSAAAVATRQIADSESVPVVDLAGLVRNGLPRPAGWYFGDYEHFTDAGAALVAGALAPKVLGTTRGTCVSYTP